MSLPLTRRQYAEMYGPTVGDQVRLGDTELFIEVERDLIAENGGYGNEIKFGATIEIEDEDTEKKQKYQIVGDYESDIENGKLSISSPLARGLIGKSKDDSVEINSPKGQKNYTILSVKYI